jgi:hypothetical protein
MDKPSFIFLFYPPNVPYAENFLNEAHLNRIFAEAQEIVSAAFKAAGV